MTQTVTIDLGDGTTVDAEVIGDLPFQGPDAGGTGDAVYGDVGVRDRVGELGTAVALTMEQVRGTVRSVGRWAAQTVTESAGSPDSFEVEFGIKLAVKSGHLLGVIAEAGSEAGLTVRMSWDLASRRAAARAGGPGDSAAAQAQDADGTAASAGAGPTGADGTGPDGASGTGPDGASGTGPAGGGADAAG
ncbi:CU044_2847 family protein [Actinacidiphila sp. DG2A-62]|uniref:CU044_2847 family protein n=1 Tax=Actinacidiphila sp. DG2A-62 TaxID=3108821 RepID=UPI002DBF8524|nr:CU044_2847 family protein [Actinacidiphila sp. DG2A-62]MEC3997497.1 CU044_2847 family protein [Actinacidiphila sp. DG2A-62]